MELSMQQMERDVTDTKLPATIVDDAGFKSLVNAWKYAEVWDSFDLVYDGKPNVPARLHDYTIVASNDPKEPYGVLLQMSPVSAAGDAHTNYAGKKLLAKVRLS
jgi:hypothetical protein